MGFFSRFFGKKENAETQKASSMEDYMSLIRVYFQCAMASELGITNLAMLPDLRMFKQTLRIPTTGNKLGINEKSKCKKMLRELYGTEDLFFKELDQSLKRNCRKPQDIQNYMYMFQGFTQDTLMLLGNLMKLKLRLPSFFKGAIRTMTEKTVNDILTKNDYDDASVMKTCVAIREYKKRLGFSQEWMNAFTYQVIMLAKKEKPQAEQKG